MNKAHGRVASAGIVVVGVSALVLGLVPGASADIDPPIPGGRRVYVRPDIEKGTVNAGFIAGQEYSADLYLKAFTPLPTVRPANGCIDSGCLVTGPRGASVIIEGGTTGWFYVQSVDSVDFPAVPRVCIDGGAGC